MTISVNNIPSRNVPFTDKQGCISPVWHEFLRSFVAETVAGTISEEVITTTVAAGNGLTGGGIGAISLNVGQGSGIVVNADDVGVDIVNQPLAAASLDDFMLIADTSAGNALRKAKVRGIVELNSPGGDNTHVQYNDNGILGGNSLFTTTGAGSVSISNMTFNGNTISTTNTNGDLTISPNGTGAIIFNNTIHNLAGSTTDHALSLTGNGLRIYGANSTTYIDAVAAGWRVQAATGKDINVTTTDILVSGLSFRMSAGLPIQRSTTPSITASTTQTQGQGALTSDINEISVCANVNDTVTLPAGLAGRSCLVINNGAQTLKVFPASGADLGAGTNTSTTIVSGSRKWFVAFNTTTWEPVL